MGRKRIRTFDTFTAALASFETKDRDLFSWTRNRTALTHALALRLKETLTAQGSDLDVDMGAFISRSQKVVNPDILVHDRKEKRVLALVCRSEYLKEEEQEALVGLQQTAKCELVMAISFLPQKRYCLLYRVADGKIEYHHFDRNTLTSSIIRISGKEDEDSKDQLSFGKMR